MVAEHRLPGWVWDAFVTESDDAVFAGHMPTPGSVGLDLHVVSPSGDITSYGDDDLVRAQASDEVLYVAGNRQTLWVLPETGNRLVRWDLRWAESRVTFRGAGSTTDGSTSSIRRPGVRSPATGATRPRSGSPKGMAT